MYLLSTVQIFLVQDNWKRAHKYTYFVEKALHLSLKNTHRLIFYTMGRRSIYFTSKFITEVESIKQSIQITPFMTYIYHFLDHVRRRFFLQLKCPLPLSQEMCISHNQCDVTRTLAGAYEPFLTAVLVSVHGQSCYQVYHKALFLVLC